MWSSTGSLLLSGFTKALLSVTPVVLPSHQPVLQQATKHLSSAARGLRRCNSLDMLHDAVAMGQNIIPEPAGATLATEAEVETLFPFTHNISQFRGRSIDERGLIVHYVPQAEEHPSQRTPSESYFSITYPFTTNKLLRDQYQRFSSPFLRVGLVLEDLDSFAADVATRHLGGLPPGYTVVTAAIDKLALTTAGPAQQQQHQQAPSARADAGSSEQHQPPSGWGSAQQQQQQQEQQQQQQQQEEGEVGPDAEFELKRQLSHRASIDVTQYPLSVHSDLRLVGQVCWAGRSSMEVLVELCTAPPAVQAAAAAAANAAAVSAGHGVGKAAAAAAGGSSSSSSSSVRWTPRAVAHFVMVLAKSQQQPVMQQQPTTQQQQQQPTSEQQQQQQEGPAWTVPAVAPSTPLEQMHFDTAAARAAAHRAKRHQTSLLSGPEPGPPEVHLLYQLAESQLQRQIAREQQQEEEGAGGAGRHLVLQQGGSSAREAVPMSSTSQSHLAVMHAQDRNNANNIFGGHLLKLAAELAYSTAVLHSGRHCEAVALGDVSFRRPVPIGCVLSFRAKVVYTSGSLLRVSVVATKHQQLLERPSELHASVTNDFSFVFCAVGSHPLRPVEPESLREAVQYLAAHRQHLADGYHAPPALLQPGMEHILTSFAVA